MFSRAIPPLECPEETIAVAACLAVRSEPPKQHKSHNDDQDGAEDADTTVAVAVAIATKAPTEASHQEDDKENDENESYGHGPISFCKP
jgi:hypothetical protein